MEKIKVLIVDDSRIFRSALEKSLEGVNDVEIIGSVFNGAKALEFIQKLRPDIATLDVEMPGMDGLSVLNAIQKANSANPDFHPICVIMISAFTKHGADVTIKALESGAFDFITKPEARISDEGVLAIRNQLLKKIRSFKAGKNPPALVKTGKADLPSPPGRLRPSPIPQSALRTSRTKVILIGGSTGGPKALGEILPELCEKTDAPIFVIQHMPPKFTESLAKSLDKKCRHTVMEGKHGEIVRPGHVYIAPGGKHMLIRKFDNGFGLVTNEHPPEQGCRPSINIFFRSAAAAYGGEVLAIILTGMGSDGASGILPLKRAGADIIVQDQATSVVWGMPKSALDTDCVDEVVPLSGIPATVVQRMREIVKK